MFTAIPITQNPNHRLIVHTKQFMSLPVDVVQNEIGKRSIFFVGASLAPWEKHAYKRYLGQRRASDGSRDTLRHKCRFLRGEG